MGRVALPVRRNNPNDSLVMGTPAAAKLRDQVVIIIIIIIITRNARTVWPR